jgi:hypothetical protein
MTCFGLLAVISLLKLEVEAPGLASNKFLEASVDLFSFALMFRLNVTSSSDRSVDLMASETSLSYDNVFAMAENYPEQVCVPDSFGIPEAKAKIIFPEYHYPKCRDRFEVAPSITLDLEHNTFTLECSSTGSEQFFSGPGDLPIYASRESVEGQIHLQAFNGTGTLRPDDEYVLATCNGKVEAVEHWPRFKEDEYMRITANSSPDKKPLIVLMLAGDSYSRRHFYQKLPKTIEYLNDLKDDYYVEDFKLHNVMGDGTGPNIAPIFTQAMRLDEVEGKDPFDNLKDSAIWKLFKSHDFMTLFVNESCDYRTHLLLGLYPELDHVSRQMYCALYEASDYSTSKNDGDRQRCVGPEMSHFWAMQYIRRFSDLYPKANQFIYAHLTPAHEASGQHAATLDDDLVSFLDGYLKAFQETHEIVILLHGDHGMRFGEWKRDTAAMQEMKLPAFFLIASNSLMDRLPRSREIVGVNSWRLFSKKDIRHTLRFLAMYPDFQEPELEAVDGVNLFTQEISEKRTCKDAFIPSNLCSCMEYTPVDFTKDPEFTNLAHFLASEAVNTMNRVSYSSPQNILTPLCEHVELNSIQSLEILKIDDEYELVRLNFSLQNKANSLVSSIFMASPMKIIDRVIEKRHTKLYYDNSEEVFVFREFRIYVKMIAMERIDKFEGYCEQAARAQGLKPDFCFCR